MTRLALLFVLGFLAAVGCKKDSSNHSHGAEEHSHEGNEAHDHDDNKPADPPTQEVPVATSDAGTAAKADPAKAEGQGDAAPKDQSAEPASGGTKKKSSDHDNAKGEHKGGHDHEHGVHTHD